MEIICAGYPKVGFWLVDGESLSENEIQEFFKKGILRPEVNLAQQRYVC